METIDITLLYKLLSDNLTQIEKNKDRMTHLQMTKFYLEKDQFIGKSFNGTGIVKDIVMSKLTILAPNVIMTGGGFSNVILVCDFESSFYEKMLTINKSDWIEFSGTAIKIIQPSSRFLFNLDYEKLEDRGFECIYLNLKSINKKKFEVPPKNRSCFIATVCYGDYNATEVILLKNYRDNVLLKTNLGRIAINIYYLLSPSIASILVKSETAKAFVRKNILAPIVSKIKIKQ